MNHGKNKKSLKINNRVQMIIMKTNQLSKKKHSDTILVEIKPRKKPQ